MSEKNQPAYPDAEYCPPRTCQADYLHDFMRLYEPGVDSQNQLIGLNAFYGNTAYLRGMREYSRLIPAARLAAGYKPESPMDINFYFGALMSAYTSLEPLPLRQRNSIFKYDPFSKDYDSKTGYHVDGQHIDEVVDKLANWEDNYWSYLGIQPDEVSRLVYDTAAHVYAGRDEDPSEMCSFLSGFLFSQTIIDVVREDKRA